MVQGRDRLQRPAAAAFVAGSLALLVAMAVDFVAVLGRHLGKPFLGSIELVQVCVVVAASAAVIGATLSGAHAAVHVITERMRPAAQRAFARLAAVFSVLFFAALAVASIWLTADTFGGHERTDLLKLSILPFRAIWCVAMVFAALISVVGIFRPRLPSDEAPREP